jgi:cell division protein FtsZ
MGELAERTTKSVQGQGPSHRDPLKPGQCRIAIVGVGDAGNRIIDHLRDFGITDARCIAINTAKECLATTRASQEELMSKKITRGSGWRGDARVRYSPREDSETQIGDLLSEVDVVFIAVGLGESTATNAGIRVAKLARHKGAIVIGVAMVPQGVDGQREELMTQGFATMQRQCDTILMIDNNKLKRLAPRIPSNKTEASRVADQVLADIIIGMVETISRPNLINLDFSSFEAIIRKGGVAIVGVGQSDAPNRAEEAVQNALRSPLLDVDYSAAAGALIHVSGDDRMTVEEVNKVGKLVAEMMHNNALVSWGARVNPSLPGIMRVTLLMTGLQSPLLRGFAATAHGLYDMERPAEPEEPLNINLELYQLENFKSS